MRELSDDRVGGFQRQRRHGERAVGRRPARHRGAAWQEQVVMIMRAAVRIDHRGLGIGPHDAAAHDVVAVEEFRRELEAGRAKAVRQRAQAALLSLLISGGMLIPGNVPNIVCANKLGMRSGEWARVGLPLGLIMLGIYFAFLLVIG